MLNRNLEPRMVRSPVGIWAWFDSLPTSIILWWAFVIRSAILEVTLMVSLDRDSCLSKSILVLFSERRVHLLEKSANSVFQEMCIPSLTIVIGIANYPLGKPPALPGDSQSLTFSGVGSSFRASETRPGIQKPLDSCFPRNDGNKNTCHRLIVSFFFDRLRLGPF